MKSTIKPITFLIISFLSCGLSGCAYTRLKSQTAALNGQYSVYGQVKSLADHKGGQLIAIVYRVKNNRNRIYAYRTIERRLNRFVFLLDPGDYRVLVFHDLDKDYRIDSDEAVALAQQGRILNFSDITTQVDLDLTLSATGSRGSTLRRFPRRLSRRIRERNQQFHVAVGDVTDFSSRRFSTEAGALGLWEPRSFLKQHGIGIYQNEEYDPSRIPVLFVSGAGGSVKNWSYFMERLDPHRYQSWYYLYPSGIRISRSGDVLHQVAQALHQMYEFNELHVVAHSMGGLVAREFIIRQLAEQHGNYVTKFISIATPWGGHELASKGIDYLTTPFSSPVPAWHDVVPGSKFLQRLFYKKIAPNVDFHLIHAQLPDAESDGTISSISQTLQEARDEAVSIRKFEAGHVAVLTKTGVFDHVQAILDSKPTILPEFPISSIRSLYYVNNVKSLE
jgi:pimeloyl-ACP methyl ester carboxylesterase